MLGHRRWDEFIQQVANERRKAPWRVIAQDREIWAELKHTFVARVLRVPARQVEALPPGHHMMPDMRVPPVDARPEADDDQVS